MTKKKSASPLPQKKEPLMDFSQAIKHLASGSKIRRVSWPQGEFGFLSSGWVKISRGLGVFTWEISDGDLEGKDWVTMK